jgi:hypothetical protein
MIFLTSFSIFQLLIFFFFLKKKNIYIYTVYTFFVNYLQIGYRLTVAVLPILPFKNFFSVYFYFYFYFFLLIFFFILLILIKKIRPFRSETYGSGDALLWYYGKRQFQLFFHFEIIFFFFYLIFLVIYIFF